MIDPKYTFWLGVFVTIFTGIGGGTVHLTNMIPEGWIPTVTAWNNFLGFVGTAIMTTMSGMSSRAPGPLVKGDSK